MGEQGPDDVEAQERAAQIALNLLRQDNLDPRFHKCAVNALATGLSGGKKGVRPIDLFGKGYHETKPTSFESA